jgi:CP family cyanate transporter-like MFS transporter
VFTTLPVLLFGLTAFSARRIRARFGEERALRSLLLLLFMSLLLRFVPSDGALFLSTVTACGAIGVMNVLMPGLIGRRFASRVGWMMGLYTATLTAGAALSAALTAPLWQASDSTSLALAIWALPVALAFVVWRARPGDNDAVGPSVIPVGPGPVMWRSSLAWQVTFFMGLGSLVYFAPLSWLPVILRDAGIDPVDAGLLLALMNMVGLVATLVAPIIAARGADQRKVVTVTAAAAMLGVLGLLVAPAEAPVIWVALLGIGQGSALGVALLLMVKRARDSSAAVGLSGMAQGFGYIVASTGPLAMGLLHSVSGGWAWPLIALLGATLALLLAGLGAGRDRFVPSPH